VERGDYAAGRRLIAAAQAAGGERALTSWAATRLEYEHTLARLHAGLTQPELDAEGAVGRLMSLEGAAALARSVTRPVRQATPEGLTRREWEIVEMVAQGKTNGEIAAALVVSKRTVEKHIAHILNKLGVTNRPQVVIWAVENGLVKPGHPSAG
jgi:DNA-binding NarL/FixJ family response regulator